MDTVIKGFLGVFIFAMIVYLSAGLISAEMDTHAARSYMDSAKKEIAESNMSPTVITAVQEQAARNGYQMQITTYGDVLETDGVELKMTYHYKIPILGVDQTHMERKRMLGTKELFMKQYRIIRYLNIQEEQHKKQ